MIIGIDASRAFGDFFGGPESYSYNLIRAILKLSTADFFRLYLPPRAEENPRFRSFFVGLPTDNYQLITINWPRFWTQGGLALECLKNPPDVLFVPAHTLPIIHRPSLKTVVAIHDLGAQYLPNYHKFPQKYYLNWSTEYAVRQATNIIAVSNYTRNDLINKLKVESGKVKVIHEGVDREIFYPRSSNEVEKTKREYGIIGDYFLFVGTIQPRKNLVRLIESFSRVVRDFQVGRLGSDPIKVDLSMSLGSDPRNLSLVLVGAPGWLNEEIYSAPKKYGVETQVKFLGPVENAKLVPLLSGCKAFVFPSLFEGFGLAPLEALACGAPTILSNITSLPEVGGEAAFYVDPNSSYDIAEKMEQVMALTGDERDKIRVKSLAQAAKFSWEKAAQETLKVIEESK